MRDTLFSALYGSMVMFDTHDHAHAYQVRCKRSNNMSLPILVEEDGASLVSERHSSDTIVDRTVACVSMCVCSPDRRTHVLSSGGFAR